MAGELLEQSKHELSHEVDEPAGEKSALQWESQLVKSGSTPQLLPTRGL